jgi:hypothetical protein
MTRSDWAEAIYTALLAKTSGTDSLISEVLATAQTTFGSSPELTSLNNDIITQLLGSSGPHNHYESFYPASDSGLSAIELAIQSIDSIGTLESPPAVVNSAVTEALTINYRQPVSVSEISFDILRNSCYTELWYLDRSNNWRQVVDEQSNPINLTLSSASTVSWYRFHTNTYPIIAKSLQFRITRIPDSLIGNTPYCVGIKNTLVRRNVYNRSSALQQMEDEQDALGNTISKMVKDWDASKAIDDNPNTFWRSFPQPDPNAVVSLYVDVRNSSGGAQLLDKVYIDPVYTGQILNLYYSNDDTVMSRRLNPAALMPDTTQVNYTWDNGKGLRDNVPATSSTLLGSGSSYSFSFNVGLMSSEDCWVGIQWTPSFDSTAAPSQNATLFQVTPTSTTNLSSTTYWPTIYYNVSNQLVLKFQNKAGGTFTYTTATLTSFTKKTPLNIVVGWTYSTNTNSGGPEIKIMCYDSTGTVHVDYRTTDSALPRLITLDGKVGFSQWRGTFGAHIVKQDTYFGQDITNVEIPGSGFEFSTSLTPVGVGGSYSTVQARTGTHSLKLTGNTAAQYAYLAIANGTGRFTFSAVAGQTYYLETYVYGEGTNGQVLNGGSAIYIGLSLYNSTNGYLTNVNTGLTTASTALNGKWTKVSGYVTIPTGTTLSGTSTLSAAAIASPFILITANVDDGNSYYFDDMTVGLAQINYPGMTDFLANPNTYCNPDPILVSPNGIAQSSSLDESILAVDWTAQQFASGGAHISNYSDKEWTPIWANYITEKGFLNLPQTTSMKYLKLEFTQLTAEPYPIYDQGVRVSYQVYPITITATSQHGHKLNFLGAITDVFGGIGSVNWLNPSTVSRAINSVFGRTTQTVQTQIGPGYTTDTLPTAIVSAAQSDTRTESSSPWIYRRTPVSPFALVQNFFSTIFGNRNQHSPSTISVVQQKLISEQTTINPPSPATPATLPIQGQDWYVFPGQTLRMPASVIDGLTKSKVWLRRDHNKGIRTRFTATAIHQYETKTVTLDAAIAYFAGIREIQPYVLRYIDYEDPAQFSFDHYSTLSGWSMINTQQLDSGPVTAASNPYVIQNPGFDIDLSNWTPSSSSTSRWNWDNSQGYSIEGSWQPGIPFVYGAAHCSPNSTNQSLTSDPILVTLPSTGSVTIKFSAWVVYKDVNSTTAGKIYVDAVGRSGTTVQSGYSSIALDTVGTPTMRITHPVGSSLPVLGVKAVKLYGSCTLPYNSGITNIQLRLNVDSGVSAGDVWFDDIKMMPDSAIVGSLYNTIATKSTFSKVRCDFRDNGTVRSDSLWAQTDPKNANIDRYALSYYASTIPTTLLYSSLSALQAAVPTGKTGVVYKTTDTNKIYKWVVGNGYTETTIYSSLGGSWEDTFGTWGYLTPTLWLATLGTTPPTTADGAGVEWGTPFSEVAIQIDPNMVFDDKRVIHFARASGAQQAGIVVRQETNFIPNGVFRICATWYKQKETTNTINFRLRRVSTGAIVFEESLTEVKAGYWHTHQTQWATIPDDLNQIYALEFVLDGSQEDDIYLNDLWVDISHIRYHVRLGGYNQDISTMIASQSARDVTPLRHADHCSVSSTQPVSQMEISATIYSDRAYVYSSTFTPLYLK